MCIDRRSNIYSSRPRFIMGSEILTGGVVIGFIAYGELYAVILFLVTVKVSYFSKLEKTSQSRTRRLGYAGGW